MRGVRGGGSGDRNLFLSGCLKLGFVSSHPSRYTHDRTVLTNTKKTRRALIPMPRRPPTTHPRRPIPKRTPRLRPVPRLVPRRRLMLLVPAPAVPAARWTPASLGSGVPIEDVRGCCLGGAVEPAHCACLSVRPLRSNLFAVHCCTGIEQVGRQAMMLAMRVSLGLGTWDCEVVMRV